MSVEPYNVPDFVSQTKTEPPNDATASQSTVRAEIQRVGDLVADRQRRPDRTSASCVEDGDRPGVVGRDERSAVRGEDGGLDVRRADREGLSEPPARRDVPDPDCSVCTGHGDPLRVRAEGDRLRARARGMGDDRRADDTTTRDVPQRDVVRLPCARGHDVAVRAEANDGEHRRSRSAAAGSCSSRSSLLVDTSHSSTRPFAPATASVRPSGLKSTPSQSPWDERSGWPARFHVPVSQSVAPSQLTVARSLPSGLNAAALTGDSNPCSHARIREPCSSAPISALRVSTESSRLPASSARRRARSGCSPAVSRDCAARRPACATTAELSRASPLKEGEDSRDQRDHERSSDCDEQSA